MSRRDPEQNRQCQSVREKKHPLQAQTLVLRLISPSSLHFFAAETAARRGAQVTATGQVSLWCLCQGAWGRSHADVQELGHDTEGRTASTKLGSWGFGLGALQQLAQHQERGRDAPVLRHAGCKSHPQPNQYLSAHLNSSANCRASRCFIPATGASVTFGLGEAALGSHRYGYLHIIYKIAH